MDYGVALAPCQLGVGVVSLPLTAVTKSQKEGADKQIVLFQGSLMNRMGLPLPFGAQHLSTPA